MLSIMGPLFSIGLLCVTCAAVVAMAFLTARFLGVAGRRALKLSIIFTGGAAAGAIVAAFASIFTIGRGVT